MFRSRFNEAFPKSLPNFGPQELERDVTESVPGQRVEQFLCAVLSLLLNRKQDVKYDAIDNNYRTLQAPYLPFSTTDYSHFIFILFLNYWDANHEQFILFYFIGLDITTEL